MSKPKRAAIYCRVSTETQEREGTSLESQAARCLAHVEDFGWEVESVVHEQGSGGDIDGRPKLASLLTMARAGHIDALVCYHIDRLSRDLDDQGWLRRELRKAGVELVLVTGQQDAVGQLVEGFAGMQERKQASERTTRGKQQSAANGKYLPGHPPYGYRHRRKLVGRTQKVVALDEDLVTAPILREMFEFLARGGSATGLAKWLNNRGIAAPRGQRWRCNTIRPIISNSIYKGRQSRFGISPIAIPGTGRAGPCGIVQPASGWHFRRRSLPRSWLLNSGSAPTTSLP